jgi:PhnB protein
MWTPSISSVIGLWTVYTTPVSKEGIQCKSNPICSSTAAARRRQNFYRRTLGAEVVMLMRFKDGPEPQQPGMVPPGAEDKVMHMCLRVGDTTFMASDGRCLGQPNFQGFSLSLTVPNEAEAEQLFASLGDGGQVQMPLAKTFFSPRFGMVADRFGVSWMVYVAP